MALRLKKQGEKALERALNRTEKDGPPTSKPSSWRGKPEQETIDEDEEPPPTPMVTQSRQHQRESAETDV
jgi:PH and SEC7 domain-containing protein